MKKEELFKIFQNLHFNLIENKNIGTLVEMSAEEAFVFSSIVGSNYMINESGVTMKTRSEVLARRSVFQNNHYIYSPALFSRDIEGNLKEGNSLNILESLYPEIFEGSKYIFIQDIKEGQSSNIEADIYEILKRNHVTPENILLFKNFETGSSFEPFLEYLAAKAFIEKGYIVENQVPWFQQSFYYKGKTLNGGTPDFSAFNCSISSYLDLLGLVSNTKGMALNLLPVVSVFRRIKKVKDKELDDVKDEKRYELIIGEVKSSSSSLDNAVMQIEKYKKVDLADQLYTIIPDVADNRNDCVGEIYLEQNQIKVKPATIAPDINRDHQVADNGWLCNYIKMLLLGNVRYGKIINIIEAHRRKTGQQLCKKYQAHHLLDAILSMDIKTYIKTFLGVI